jgi:putative addiction module component (TIGR02574 family)
MPTTMMKTLGLDQLSTAERLALVEELWDSIADSPEAVTLSGAHQQDLQRRLEAHKDNPTHGSPWEEVKARLQRAAQ